MNANEVGAHIAEAAFRLSKELARDRIPVLDDPEAIALKLIKNAAFYRDMLKPFDHRPPLAAVVPTNVKLSAA